MSAGKARNEKQPEDRILAAAEGQRSFAGVLAQCPALAHLDFAGNRLGAVGAESLAGVPTQCTALAHLDLQARSGL